MASLKKRKTAGHDELQAEHWDRFAGRLPSVNLSYPAILERESFFEFAGLGEKALTILEIGCGTGRYTLALLERGHRVIATDVSQKSLDCLRDSAAARGLVEHLSLERNSFEEAEACQKYFNEVDLVLCVNVIHHFHPQKREQIFSNMVKSVKKGGAVVAMEPNPLNPFYYPLFSWNEITNADTDRWATDKGILRTSLPSLRRLFQGAGLAEIQFRRYALFPSRFGVRFRFILGLNEFLLKLPLIKNMSLFTWIKGGKV
jgi:SAM-dependent methyltransferase